MDALDYGRRFTVDAFRHNSGLLEAATEVESYLSGLHAFLEGGRAPSETVVVEDEHGFSVAIRGADANAALHLFPGLGTISLQVFSRRDVLLSDLTRNLGERFGVGRFESHLGNATKALPKDRELLQRVLAGDRDYARVRLDDLLLAL